MDKTQWFMTVAGACLGALVVGSYLALQVLDKILGELKKIREAANETAYYTKYPGRRPRDDDDDLPFPND